MTDFVRNPSFTDFKESVRAASAGVSVDLSVPPPVIDGVTLNYGDMVLLKDQGNPADNGVYLWSADAPVLQRAPGSIDHQVTSGNLVIVEEGDVNADSLWMLTTDDPIELGVTPLVFEQFVGATGPQGPAGPAGAPGVGVPVGGTAGQVLEKVDGTDYNTQWATPSGGGGKVGSIVLGGFASTTSGFTTSLNSYQDLPGMAFTVTGDGVNSMEFEFTTTNHFLNGSNSIAYTRFYNDTDAVQLTSSVTNSSGSNNSLWPQVVKYIMPPFTGTKTFKVQVRAQGSCGWQAQTSGTMYFWAKWFDPAGVA